MPSIVESFRYGHLLAMLVLVLVGGPFLGSFRPLAFFVGEVLIPLTFVLAILACARSRWQVLVGVTLLVGMQAARILNLLTPPEAFEALYPVFGFAFVAYITNLIVRKIFVDTRDVTGDTIVGAIAVYLLIGIAWAFAFLLLDQARPGSFVHQGEPISGANVQMYMGFSFITLTTLGYGNFVPIGARAEALAYSEAIFGQLYLTILVARLIGMYLARGPSQRGP